MRDLKPLLRGKNRKVQDVVVFMDDILCPDAYHEEDMLEPGIPAKPDSVPWLHALCTDKRLSVHLYSGVLEGLEDITDVVVDIKVWLVQQGFPEDDLPLLGVTQRIIPKAIWLGRNMFWASTKNHLVSATKLLNIRRSNQRVF